MSRISRPSRASKSSSKGTRDSSIISKRSQIRARTSLNKKSVDDYEFQQSTKCFCQNCKMRNINKPRTEEEIHEREAKLAQVLASVEENGEEAIADLEALVKIKSISVEPNHLRDSLQALEWVTTKLADLRFRTHQYPITNAATSCFLEPQQKVLFANYFSTPMKSTVLVYGHVDVVPAERDCWLSDPFEMHAKEGLLYGRGVTSGKGMIIGWLQAIEAWLKASDDLPINVKFIVDMLHEVGSDGMQHYIQARSDFFLDVDYIVFDTNTCLNTDRPVIACSLTGWAHFGIEVRGANKSLESGLAGGLVFEPMVDLCHLMNSLLNQNQEISIPRIDHMVKRLTSDEWYLLETAEFSVYKYSDELGVRRVKNEGNKVDLLQNRWCKPTLTMHGVQGSDYRSECSRTLPMQVTGKFSIKLVPDQELHHVHNSVKEYLQKIRDELGLGTNMKLLLLDACEPTSWSTTSKRTAAVIRAVGDVYQKQPIASAGIAACLPIASVFRKLVNKPIILVPFAMRVDRHYQQNEYVQEHLFIQHSKVCASLLHELSNLPVKCKCGAISEYCQLKGVAERLSSIKAEESKEPSKRNVLSGMIIRKPSQFTKKKKSIKDYLCMPFNYKKPKESTKSDVSG